MIQRSIWKKFALGIAKTLAASLSSSSLIPFSSILSSSSPYIICSSMNSLFFSVSFFTFSLIIFQCLLYYLSSSLSFGYVLFRILFLHYFHYFGLHFLSINIFRVLLLLIFLIFIRILLPVPSSIFLIFLCLILVIV